MVHSCLVCYGSLFSFDKTEHVVVCCSKFTFDLNLAFFLLFQGETGMAGRRGLTGTPGKMVC